MLAFLGGWLSEQSNLKRRNLIYFAGWDDGDDRGVYGRWYTRGNRIDYSG